MILPSKALERSRMRTRRATVKDAENIAYCQMRGWQEGYKGIVSDDFLKTINLQESVERWQGNLSDMTNEKYTLVAMEKGKCLGFLSVGPPRDSDAGFDSELWAIYIDPEYWGQGVGRKLFQRMVKDLKARDIKNTYVWCLKDNMNGRKFYKALGGVHIYGLAKKFVLEEQILEEVPFGWVSL